MQHLFTITLDHARQLGALTAQVANLTVQVAALQAEKDKPKPPTSNRLTFEQWMRLAFALAVLAAALSRNLTVREAIGLMK